MPIKNYRIKTVKGQKNRAFYSTAGFRAGKFSDESKDFSEIDKTLNEMENMRQYYEMERDLLAKRAKWSMANTVKPEK